LLTPNKKKNDYIISVVNYYRQRR